MPPAADIALLDDTGPTQKTKNIHNSGFFMMRLSAPTAALWSAMVEYQGGWYPGTLVPLFRDAICNSSLVQSARVNGCEAL